MRVVGSLLVALSIVCSAAFLVFSSEQIKDDSLNYRKPQVVMLTNREGDHGGTGFYVTAPSGTVYTLTNQHVCGIAENGLIYSRNGNDINVLSVLAVYPEHDLCLLTTPYGVSGFKVAKSVRDGQNIYILGHPLLMPKSLTKGQISGGLSIDVMQGYNVPCEGKGFKKIPSDPNDLMAALLNIQYACVRSLYSIAVTANILPGNSGSPVLNSYGRVVGVAFAGTPGSGRGFIVPLDEVQNFLAGK